MLRRQPHQAALNYVARKITAHNKTLDDLQTMMTKTEEDTFSSNINVNKSMWLMLDELVWLIVDKVRYLDGKMAFVLSANKDKDEDEAWADQAKCWRFQKYAILNNEENK
jgi:hypothetical protein